MPRSHSFPPMFVMPGEWRRGLEAMALELEFTLRTSESIEERFQEIIVALEHAASGR